MSDGKENIPSYIAREKCGCIVGAIVDDPDANGYMIADMRKTIKEWIDDGLVIERVTVGFVREHGLEKCELHKDKNQQWNLY